MFFIYAILKLVSEYLKHFWNQSYLHLKFALP